MKTIHLFFSFLFLPFLLSANISVDDFTVDKTEIRSYRVIEKSESCTVVEIVTKDNTTILNVIAGIATALIPDAVEAICIKAGGDPKYCEVGYKVSEALVSLGPGKTAKGITGGLKWIAKKMGWRTGTSKVAVAVKSYEAANNMKEVFNAYKEAGCMKWETAEVSSSGSEFEDWDKAIDYSRSSSFNRSSNDVYTLNWQVGYSKYTGLLKLNSFGSGTFRVLYYNPNCNCNQLVEQRMSVHFGGSGIFIRGRNPVNVQTGSTAYGYAADNFIVSVNGYGGVSVMVVDDQNVTAYGQMKRVEGYSKQELLEAYGM